MNRDEVINLVSTKLKLIRTEKGYTQDKMAEIVGISKKTLVQIEKGRTTAGWTNVVAITALFRDSEILQAILGDHPLEIIETIAHAEINLSKEKTMGGKVWWKEISVVGKYRLQQNMISSHFRIIDDENYRLYSSFNAEDAKVRFEELLKLGSN